MIVIPKDISEGATDFDEDKFILTLIKQKLPVSIFLKSGIRLEGIVLAMSPNFIMLTYKFSTQQQQQDPKGQKQGYCQVVSRHSISTIS